VPVNTLAYSCATPIAATPDRPVASCRARCGPITASLAWSLPNLTHGISLASAKAATAFRNRSPSWRNNTGEGNGNPRCPDKNATTCALVCKIGT
jgi:hypothetical protein